MEYADLTLDLLSLALLLYCARRLRPRDEPLPEVVDEPEPEPAAVEVEPVAPYKVELELLPLVGLPPERGTTIWPEPPALELPTGCALKGHTWQLRGQEETQGRMVRIYRCLHCPDKLREEVDL